MQLGLIGLGRMSGNMAEQLRRCGNTVVGYDQRHAIALADKQIVILDRGVSGGVWGLTEGYGLMAGGEDATIDHARPLPVITASLFARLSSRHEDSPAIKTVAALRAQCGGHAVESSSGESGESGPGSLADAYPTG